MLRRIAFDMTPLGPGGQTGGSGVVAISLIREIGRLKPEWELDLLTSSASHDELAGLDAQNVRRSRVLDAEAASRLRSLARQVMSGMPAGLRVTTKDTLWKLRHRSSSTQADLMFCPFTSSNFWRPGLPLVVLVHDLQHVAFAQFFAEDQRLRRDQHLCDAAAHADAVVCVSDFVRQTLREHVHIEDRRLVTIHHGLLQGFETPPDTANSGDYLLYPANFWPHKNHRLLFDAFGAYRCRRPGGVSKLICTGAPGEAMASLRTRAEALIGADRVEFRGYLPEAEYADLLDHCAALIYPSLYEGFGMPVLEAMARGKPVLCSRIPALEEVAGDAARYFDPTRADDIAREIASLDEDPDGTARRVECGRSRASEFGDAASMAQSYINLFERVLATQ